MPIYWSMLLAAVVIGILGYNIPMQKMKIDGKNIYRLRIELAIFFVAYVVFFIGFRDRVLDTGAYIRSFNMLPVHMDELLEFLKGTDTGKGFYLLAGIFKIFISKSHYAWLFFLAIVSCLFLFKSLYKYSIDFPMTAYLFIADTIFTWLLNGTRQFLVVCILFGCCNWILQGKKIRYIILALALTTIHSSAVFMAVVVLFISTKKIFDKKMMFFVALAVVGTYYSEHVFEFLSETSESMDYVNAIETGGGSNIIRFIVIAIPIMLVILNYKNVKNIAPDSIKLAINMSLVGSCFSFAATFTNGILVGRMPIYFTVYNLYLLPWILKNCFTRDSKKIVWVLCVLGYFAYFYYQMCIAWGGLGYVSDILGLYY